MLLHKLGSMRCKHNISWQHLSQIPDETYLILLDKTTFEEPQMQQAIIQNQICQPQLMEPN